MLASVQSAWRTASFLAYGTVNFTRSSFERHQKLFAPWPKGGAFNSGRVMIVTGANSGLGFETAKFFAMSGGTVHMVCRSKERGSDAADRIRSAMKQAGIDSGAVHLHIADVSRPAQLAAFVDEFAALKSRLDVLVNNAGYLPLKRERTPEGLDSCFATNSLATYLLTVHLLPIMKESAANATAKMQLKPRVINVSSGGMYLQRLTPDDVQTLKQPEPFDGNLVYAQTKRQQVVMAEEFARSDDQVLFFSCHPGWAETPGVITAMPQFHAVYGRLMRTAAQGADTIQWLASSDRVDSLSGQFFFDRQVSMKHFPGGGTLSEPADQAELMRQLAEMDAKLWSR